MTDDALLAALLCDEESAVQGEDAAAPRSPIPLRELYGRYRDELVRYVAYTFGQGPPEPEDVAQAAFAQFAAMEGGETIGNARALLYRIARNLVLDQRRRLQVRARFARSVEAEAISGGVDELTAERVICARERLGLTLQVIRSLPPDHREVVILSRLHGLNNCEIARRKGISESGVRRLLALAMIACERAIESEARSSTEGDGD